MENRWHTLGPLSLVVPDAAAVSRASAHPAASDSGTCRVSGDSRASTGICSEHTTGRPAAWASMATMPNPSNRLGNANTSMAHSSRSGCLVVP